MTLEINHLRGKKGFVVVLYIKTPVLLHGPGTASIQQVKLHWQ